MTLEVTAAAFHPDDHHIMILEVIAKELDADRP
jgi:hypothetical protein